MLFQPRWPEKTGNSEPAGAIDLSHRPSMVPGRFFLPPFVCGGLFPLFISVHWCAIAAATKWNNCFVLVSDAVGGGLLQSAASADTTATAAAMGIVCCGRGSRSGLRGPQGRQAPTVVVHPAYWHTFVCNLRRMISPAPAKFSQRPGISPDDARAHTGIGALGVEGWVQRTGVVRTGILGPPSL